MTKLKYPSKPNSMSLSGSGIRMEVLSFKDKKQFDLLTKTGVNEEVLSKIMSSYDEFETFGLAGYCHLSFDDGTEIPISLPDPIAKTRHPIPDKFKFLLVKVEVLEGDFDIWNFEDEVFDESKLNISIEGIKLPDGRDVEVIIAQYNDDFGNGVGSTFCHKEEFTVYTSDGKNYPVVILPNEEENSKPDFPSNIPCIQIEIDEDGNVQSHEMGRITKVIQSWLKGQGWEEKPDINDEDKSSSTSFSHSVGEDFSVTCYLDAAEETEYVRMFMYFLDSKFPESKIAEVTKFVNLVNLVNGIGALTVMPNRTLRYFAAIDVEDSALEPQHISNLLSAGLRTMEARLPQYMAICFGGKTAEEAFDIEPD